MTAYKKLVRDRIPEMLSEKGLPHEVFVASDEGYRNELINKLGEEFAEFSEENSPEELADIIEVIEALKTLPEFAETENLRLRKAEEKGIFAKRYIVKGEK